MLAGIAQRELMHVTAVSDPLVGYEVSLDSVLVWATREERLKGFDGNTLKFNLKLDGRPFWGKRGE